MFGRETPITNGAVLNGWCSVCALSGHPLQSVAPFFTNPIIAEREAAANRPGRYSVIRSYDQLPTQHVHSASKDEFAFLFRSKLNRRGLERGQIASDPKVTKDHFFATGCCLVAIEVQANRRSLAHDNYVGRIGAFNGHVNFLAAAFVDCR